MSQRLTDTNDVIEILKKDLKAEIEALKTELENFKKIPGGNVQVEEFKKQLDGIKRLMEFVINTILCLLNFFSCRNESRCWFFNHRNVW